MKKIYLLLTATVLLLLSFTGISLAAAAVDPVDDSPVDVAKSIYQAFTGGHYAYAAAIALVVAVALTRKYLGARVPWLHSDQGSASLVLIGSFGTALVASLAGGGPLTIGMAEAAGMIAFVSAGSYGALNSLVIKPLAPKLPAWMQPIVLFLFQHASDPGNAAPATPSTARRVAPRRKSS